MSDKINSNAEPELIELKSEENNQEEPQVIRKPSRIWGIIGMIAFFILGGVGYCPWYIWIVVVFLGLLTISGISKGMQAFCAAIIILFGTPVIFDEEENSSSSNSYSATAQNDSSNNLGESELAGPSWIDGTWVYKGYVAGLGQYVDVAVKINRSNRQIVIVDNIDGTETGTYRVDHDQISSSTGTVLYLNNSTHTIDLGGGLSLRKK